MTLLRGALPEIIIIIPHHLFLSMSHKRALAQGVRRSLQLQHRRIDIRAVHWLQCPVCEKKLVGENKKKLRVSTGETSGRRIPTDRIRERYWSSVLDFDRLEDEGDTLAYDQ